MLYARLMFSLVICIVWSNSILAQEFNLVKSIPIQGITNASIDVRNSFYLADDKGNVFHYDSLGKEINRFSPQQPARITSLEAWKTMNIFIFYRDLQQFVYLDRFLAPSPNNFLSKDGIGFAYMASPSQDNNLWVFDNSTFSLKKLDLNLQRSILETPLELILNPANYDINLIREYQNKVYLNNSNQGILMFDNMGNYDTTLPFKTNYFNFFNDEIYFIESNDLVFYNLYTSHKRIIPLKNFKDVLYALFMQSQIILISPKEALIMQLK